MNKTIYYVSSGEMDKMYTLRAQVTETVVIDDFEGEIVDNYYIRNLSIDPDKAQEVAFEEVKPGG